MFYFLVILFSSFKVQGPSNPYLFIFLIMPQLYEMQGNSSFLTEDNV